MPLRMCIACRKSFDKDTLLRFVVKDSKYLIDKSGKEQSRGYYLCNSEDCYNKALKKKIIFSEQTLEELKKI